MSLQLLLKASLPATLEDNKPVSPTLLVGLGGTGKEILLRFRRLLVERYGSLRALPFLQFLHLDTDGTATAREQYDLKAEDDPLYELVAFSPSERVDLTIEGGTGKYVEHIETYPHIKRWFQTDGKIASLGNLGDGAGQIRMASRLGFYHGSNFANVAAQLDRARSKLKDASNPERAAAFGFELDAGSLNVVVATSLAGGTGSGTFIDMGFLLQRYFPSSERVAILLLPNFFQDYAGGGRARANGYAALTELNHHSFGRPFHANWDGVNADTLPPPPFTNTYLIDATNEAGLVIGSSGKEYDAYRMVAEFLFQDFSVSKFSGLKRATRVNLVNFNLNVYTHNFLNTVLRDRTEGENSVVGDTYPTRFGSFGLATIAFPTDRVHSACACRLARNILGFWEQTLIEDGLDRLFTTFLSHAEVSFVQGRYERRDGGGLIDRLDVEDALLVYDGGSGKTFQSFIWERAQNVRTEIETAANGDKAATLARHVEQLEQLLARDDSANPDEWGQWIRILEDNKRTYLEALRSGLRKRASEVGDNPELGVAYALSLLRELKATLHNESFHYLAYFEAAVRDWRDETQRHAHHLDQLQLELGRHERQLMFRTADLARDLEQLVAEDDQQDDLGALYNYLNARVMKQVAKRGRQICEAIDTFLGKDDPTGKGLLAEYYKLLVGFQTLKDMLAKKEAYFAKPEISELTISLYRDGDVDRWYRTWLGDPEQERATLGRVGNQLLSKVFEVPQVTAALATIQETPPGEVEERLLMHCKRYLAGLDEQPEALRMLLDGSRFSRAEREEKIRLAYRLGKVWLARAERGLDHINLMAVTADQRPCLIGVDQNDRVRFTELKQLVERVRGGGDSPPSYKSIGDTNKGAIVFYNELAGVPAFYPSSVLAPQGLKQAYERHPDKDELHIDKNRFQFGDLIPKTSEEARRYAESLKAFVLARLLGLLRVKELRSRRSDQPSFRYSFRKNVGLTVEEVTLGDELHAVDVLYRDRRPEHLTDRHYLLRQVEDAIHVLNVQRKLAVYALLLEFYTKVVYPPSEGRFEDRDITLVQYSPEYAVLEDARSHLERKLPDEHERDQMRVALETLRGRRLGEPLTYEAYVAALEPFTKPAGKVAVLIESDTGTERNHYQEVLALDLATVDRRFDQGAVTAPPKPPAAPRAAAEPPAPERACPQCGLGIDPRAVVCRHCKQTVASHLSCPHCGESRVPDDLEACWKCGMAMPAKGETLDCPRCYGFSGLRQDFPCPVCGYDPDREAEDGGSAPEDGARAAEADGGNGGNGGNGSNGGIDTGAPPAAAAATVECPACFQEVTPGPSCSECGSLLG